MIAAEIEGRLPRRPKRYIDLNCGPSKSSNMQGTVTAVRVATDDDVVLQDRYVLHVSELLTRAGLRRKVFFEYSPVSDRKVYTYVGAPVTLRVYREEGLWHLDRDPSTRSRRAISTFARPMLRCRGLFEDGPDVFFIAPPSIGTV